MKKFLALSLVAVMVLTVCGMAFADTTAILGGSNGATTRVPAIATSEAGEFGNGAFSQTAENTIQVAGIETGDSADYYQLIEWQGTAIGTSEAGTIGGWKLTALGAACGVSLSDLLDGISVSEAATIANAMVGKTKTGSLTPGTPYSASPVAAGLYYVKIIPAASNTTTIYNPVFVSADYYAGNNTVDVASENISNSAVAKKSKITLDKEVVGNTVTDATNIDTTTTYNDVKPGDIVPYKVTTKIPAYSDAYTSVTFKLTDTLSQGLEFYADSTHKFTVKLSNGGASYTVTNAHESLAADTAFYTLTTTGTDGGTYVLNFKDGSAFLRASDRGPTDVEITYYAKVNAATVVKSVNEKDNTVDLEFSHAPGEETDHLKDKTRHYSFSIDAELLGQSGIYSSELIKIGLDQNGQPLTQTTVNYHGSTQSPLAGATFRLSGTAGTTTENFVAQEYTTLADGRIYFHDLDAGTYLLEEVSAPDGYVKDGTKYVVKIIPTYVSDNGTDTTVETDILKSYTFKFYVQGDNTEIGQATLLVNNDGGVSWSESLTNGNKEDQTNFIQNRQGLELPSTGGIGTTIFYVAGLLMVLGAATVLVARRKADAE